MNLLIVFTFYKDFMLPGLITESDVNLYTFKHINKNDLISLCIKGNELVYTILSLYVGKRKLNDNINKELRSPLVNRLDQAKICT
jgi:hypothetical protein